MSIDEVNVNSLSSRFEEKLIINHKFLTNLVTTVTVQVRDKDLFRFDYDHQSLENISEEYNNDLGKIFEISGLYEVDFEFTINNRIGLRSNNNSYFSGDNRSVAKKCQLFAIIKLGLNKYLIVFLVQSI